ncbi:MAG: hypothetical protein LBL23_02975, partial [Coriobacteriales bacterium]|nr:hypothetical protein [Coriobacteriales bacterium]
AGILQGNTQHSGATALQSGAPKLKTRELTELICRRRLVLKDGLAEFRIPPDVDIFEGDDFYVTIKPRIADREGDLMLSWQGRTVAVMPLARHVDINFRELLTASVEAILSETDLLE